MINNSGLLKYESPLELILNLLYIPIYSLFQWTVVFNRF